MSRVPDTHLQCNGQKLPLESCNANVPNKECYTIATSVAPIDDDGGALKVTVAPQHGKHLLFRTVSTATHVSDFNGMFHLAPLDKLKQLFNEHIDTLDSTSARNFFLLSASINQVFPDDVLQYILSFDDVYQTKSVCKTWHKLSQINERIKLLNLCDKAQRASSLQFNDQTNNAWIVHPTRKQLNAVERELGYQGPISRIDKAIARCKSGDRILVHDGVYETPLIRILKDVEIIGIGRKAIIEDLDDEEEPFLIIGRSRYAEYAIEPQRSVFFMNLTLDCSEADRATEGSVYIGRGNSFSTHKCKFKFANIGITVGRESRLKVTNCEFDGATTAIEMSPLSAEVTVNCSTFEDCARTDTLSTTATGEHACIAIDDAYYDLQQWKLEHGEDAECTQDQMVSLKCDGNTFEDNLCYPIAERAWLNNHTNSFVARLNLKPSLTNNSLKGYNATQTRREGVLKDANTLYFNDDVPWHTS